MDGLIRHSETINRLLARYGVKFGIYKNGEFKEQLFPFDPIPRVIGHEEFCYLEKGLRQRVDALNWFLRAFVLTGSSTEVWPSGLTRFSRNPNSFAESDHPGRTILNGIEVVSQPEVVEENFSEWALDFSLLMIYYINKKTISIR